MKKPDDELVKKWNIALAKENLDVIKPRKPSRREQNDQQKSRKSGVPRWANTHRRRG